MRWLKNLFTRRKLEADLDDEVRFHLEKQIEQNCAAGMSAEEARRQALIEFGGVEQTREAVNATRWIHGLGTVLQDIRYGFRYLFRNPGFAAVAILTLALGLGANTAIFTVLEGVLIRQLPYEKPDRLFVVREITGVEGKGLLSRPDYEDIRDQSHSFEKVSDFLAYFTYTLTGEGEPRNVSCVGISKDFFPVLGIHPLLGRLYTPEEYNIDSGSILISERFWKQQLNSDPNIIGRNLILQGEPVPVIGVMPDIPDFLPETDIWAKMVPVYDFMHWRQNKFLSVVGTLKPGITSQQAEQELTTILQRATGQPSNLAMRLVPLKEALVGKVAMQLRIVMAAALLVLIIACVNVMCLLLARMSQRVSEVAVRLSLGARPARILRQFVTENLLLVGLGCGLGLVLAINIVQLARQFNLGALPREQLISINVPVLVFTILIAVAVSFLLAWAPFRLLKQLDLNEALKTGRITLGKPRAFRMLVASEVCCAVALLVAAGLLLRSFWLVQHVNPGFAPDHLLTAYLRTNHYGPEGAAYFDEAVSRVAHAPGVQSASVADCVPASRAPSATIEFDDRPSDPAKPVSVEGCWIGPDFFKTVGTPIEQGRLFTASDNAIAPPVVIVNKTMAKMYWPGQNPIGRRIAVSYIGPGRRSTGMTRFREVVGVIGDIKQKALEIPANPALYMPVYQDETNHVYSGLQLFVRTVNDPKTLWNTVRTEIHAVKADQTISRMTTMDDLLSASIAPRRVSLILFGAFATLALLLCTIGIYGTIAYSLSRRTRELGLRIALGATRGNLLRMIMKEGLLLAYGGLAVGVGLALLFTRAMQSLLFGVSALDPLTFVTACGIVAATVTAACFLPARKAANMDPASALRTE